MAIVFGVVVASAHSSISTVKEIRGATRYGVVENEPPPKLIVDAPLFYLLDKGMVWIQYRTENVRIVPM